MKTCARCKEEYPATIEYFHKRAKSSTGFASYCKECSSEVAKERKHNSDATGYTVNNIYKFKKARNLPQYR